MGSTCGASMYFAKWVTVFPHGRRIGLHRDMSRIYFINAWNEKKSKIKSIWHLRQGWGNQIWHLRKGLGLAERIYINNPWGNLLKHIFSLLFLGKGLCRLRSGIVCPVREVPQTTNNLKLLPVSKISKPPQSISALDIKTVFSHLGNQIITKQEILFH